MRAKSEKTTNLYYELKVTLRGIKPPIRRKLLVPGNFSLYKLHRVLQIAMGWTDSHLHQFIINSERFGIPDEDDWEPIIDERRYSLIKLAPAEKSKFSYEYDFGDGWEHEIVVLKILLLENAPAFAQCSEAKRACPPEDVGGTWGYEEFLNAINDPNHEEHESYLEWVGDGFDSEECDINEINRELRRIK